jgi:hypothetical protein
VLVLAAEKAHMTDSALLWLDLPPFRLAIHQLTHQ